MAADLDLLDGRVAIEAWRWTCDLAADFGQPAWRDRAADRAARLARGAGGYADGLRRRGGRPAGWRWLAASAGSARGERRHRHDQRADRPARRR